VLSREEANAVSRNNEFAQIYNEYLNRQRDDLSNAIRRRSRAVKALEQADKDIDVISGKIQGAEELLRLYAKLTVGLTAEGEKNTGGANDAGAPAPPVSLAG
jgi:hypothetical protein